MRDGGNALGRRHVAQVAAEARLVDRQVVVERQQHGRDDAVGDVAGVTGHGLLRVPAGVNFGLPCAGQAHHIAAMTQQNHPAPQPAEPNPFFETWTGAFEVPPFGAHRARAFHAGLRARLCRARRRDRGGRGAGRRAELRQHDRARWSAAASSLDRVSSVFFELAGAHTNDALLAIEREIWPKLAAHNNRILQNDALFRRIDALHRRARHGSASPPSSSACSSATTPCTSAPAPASTPPPRSGSPRSPSGSRPWAPASARTCSPTSRATRWCSRARRTSPACRTSCARRRARPPPSAACTGKHVITLSRSSVEPFLQFSARRDLREKAFRAWIARGDNGGETDNKATIAEMVALRAERAKLLGFETFAHYRLDDAMAKTPAAVRDLLDRVWAPARAGALADRDAMQELVRQEGGNFAIAPWDWRYYAEKLRKVRCDIDEATVKPYFQLHHIIDAAFYTAYKLFGLTFERRKDIAAWHPDVLAWEVLGAGRPPSRAVLRRLFRAHLQAQRRLDDDAARPGEARRRHPPAGRQRDELQQGRRRPADAALVRRRAHAVPRVRPRAARAAVGRHLSDGRRHQRAHRLGRAAVAALRALAGAARHPAPLRGPCPHRPRDPRRPAQAPARRAHLQPGLRDGRVRRLRAGRSRRASLEGHERLRRRRVRGGRARRASACRRRS